MPDAPGWRGGTSGERLHLRGSRLKGGAWICPQWQWSLVSYNNRTLFGRHLSPHLERTLNRVAVGVDLILHGVLLLATIAPI